MRLTIHFLRWTGRLMAAAVAFLLAIDILTSGPHTFEMLAFRRFFWVRDLLSLLFAGGVLGLVYAWHREQTGARIAVTCGALFLATCAALTRPTGDWSAGLLPLVPGAFLLLAGHLEHRHRTNSEIAAGNQSSARMAPSPHVSGSSHR